MLAQRMAGEMTRKEMVGALDRFTGPNLTATLSRLESSVKGVTATDCQMFLDEAEADREALNAAVELKRQAGQINVTIHALVILLCLPHLLEPGERRWRERFGEVDREHDIHVAIIREHDPDNPSHYIMQVAAKLPEQGDFEPGHSFVVGSRCIENTPPDNLNLEMFLAQLAEHGCFGLMPAIVKPGVMGEAELLHELVISKRDLFVKRAADVGATEVEAMALRQVPRRMGNDSEDDDRQDDDVGIRKDDPAAQRTAFVRPSSSPADHP